MKSKVINVDYLARVEGEGGIYVKVSGERVTDVKVNIFEPPRFFEAFLRGRHFSEVPDITARICGICPVAYQMSSCHAIEAAFGISVNGMLRELRRLLYCGEWIESHALHVYLLHAPDFLGYEDGLQMAKDHGPVVVQGLKLKKIGNEIMILLGGREIHPINVRVGGFYRVPSKAEIRGLLEKLKWARDAAVDMIHFAAQLPFPEFEQDYEFVALQHPDEYPLCAGRLVSNKGLNIAVSEYERHFTEEHVPHSNALHSHHGTKPYLVGPLARFNLNFDKLTPHCREEAKAAGVVPPVNNPFKSVVVRSIETLWACEEALRIVEHYEPPEPAAVGMTPRTGSGSGCTEAPRGILYHRYKLNEQGLVLDARIIPPTAQNLPMMEQDLRMYVEKNLDAPREQLTRQCEQTIRNYDPCISCATHAIRLDVQRDD